MITPSTLLHYWRSCLADGQLSTLPQGTLLKEVDWAAVQGGVLPGHVAEALVEDWKARSEKYKKDKPRAGNGDPVSIPLLIVPFIFIARHRHGTSGRHSDKPYAPLIIPANMALNGKLSFDPNKCLPWVAREALEPSAASEPPLGELEEFDTYRSTTPRPERADWETLMEYAEGLCKAVTGRALSEVSLDGYERGAAGVMAALPPISPSRHLITLADTLGEKEDSLPATFISACSAGPKRPQLLGDDRTDASVRHLGQMGADYPLAARQRDAIHHLSACGEGELLPVNGPPGTGKTTLLQSVVATEVVKAALAGGDPPVIVVTSTNNQAVTNVIDSFAKAEPPVHRRNDPFEGRWLPGVKSFALYLPSSSKNVDEEKYHVAKLPEYRNPLSGLPADLLQADAVSAGEATFIEAATTALGQTFGSIEDVKAELSKRLGAMSQSLEKQVKLASDVVFYRDAHPKETAEEFAQKVEAEAEAIEQGIAAAEKEAELARARAEEVRNERKELDAAIEQGLARLYPSGSALMSLLGWALGFLQPVRNARWVQCRKIIRAAGIEDGPFASLMVPKDFDKVRIHLEGVLSGLSHRLDELDRAAQEMTLQAKNEAQKARGRMAADIEKAKAWRSTEAEWLSLTEGLCQSIIDVKSVRHVTRDDLVADPGHLEDLLDVTLRHDLFLLASHYWEARWLLSARTLVDEQEDPVKAVSGKTRKATEERWRLIACLTPCFVSTLFMLSKHLQFYDREGDNKNPPMTDFVDLLIVDEAGQVPPEVGCLGLALGRKALVVGDIHQIEPVWSVGLKVDEGNITKFGLGGAADQMETIGARACSGSLMKMARQASAFDGPTHSNPGIFLNEHRRCQKPIIAVCNELVYGGQLVPRTEELADPILPPLGWANVRSQSERRGTSRLNNGEAEAIAEWLARRQGEIEGRYGKPLHELVGIITPFSAQKNAIRAALQRHEIPEMLTVGTVHALQGAEREIVLFSPVLTAEDKGIPFFDRGPNMVNVAVSRAKDSFLVLGDMRIFDPARNGGKAPSAILAKHMFACPESEIPDALYRPDFILETTQAYTIRLDNLGVHRDTLREALEHAKSRVLVVSPYLSSEALRNDNIKDLVAAARKRDVAVTIAFDPDLNKDSGRIKSACREGVEMLKEAGAKVLEQTRIHNKTLAVDDAWIVEGSFNWLSAVRDPNHRYARQERSLRYQGPDVENYIDDAWKDLAE